MGLFSSILKSFAPRRRKRRKRRGKAVRADDGIRPSDSAGAPKVVVVSLFGAGGKEISDRVAGMLAGESAVTTVRLGKTIKQNLRLGLLERLLSASEEAGESLNDEGGDLMIWGEMEDMGTVARLHFHAKYSAPDGTPGAFGLADTLDLSIPWPDGTGEIVRAVVIAAALPVASGSRRALADRLKKLLAPASKIATTFSDEVPGEYRASVHAALGNAYATAFRFGDKKALAGAVKEYEAADAYLDGEADALAWALVQTHWGAALEANARGRKDPQGMDAAIKRYGGVIEHLSRDTHAYDWALAQVRKAMALYKLASMVPEKTSTYLKASARAFEEALTVYDRGVMPHRWAEVMNHYGVAQMALGGYGSGNTVLQQAVSTFRKALEVRKREQNHELWAQTVNNLGAACFALAKRTKEEHLLEEAARCFEGAAGVFRHIPGNKKRVEVISNNLARVRHLLDDAA